MTKAGEIYYDIKLKDNGVASKLSNIDRQMQRADKAGQRTARSISQVGNQKISTRNVDVWADRVEKIGSNITNVGHRMTKVGTAMSVGFTLPIVAGLTKATHSYMEFDEQVTEINSLLRESGETSKEFGDRYDKIASYAQKASVKYGVASKQTLHGMEEMVKKGYDINQTMASMPSIFDAARASGDDFETVMSVTTSTLEQFGMISKDTNQQMQYTQHVADTLTYIADKTASGFVDMGYAMQYVGPVSHSLGYSLEDTAAAIGILSNRGIEGQKAGTGMRGMLTSLLKPSDNAAAAMKQIGLSIQDSKGNMKDLPTLLDDINKGTKDMTKTQKNAILTTIFGREPLSAVNTLLEAGGDSLRKYSKGAKEASGYTKEVADNMRKAKKFSIDQFKASLEVLEQNVGQKLMPALTPIIEWANDMIDKFNSLDGEQQQQILKWVGIAAAAGPVLSISGKMVSATGNLVTGFARLWRFLGEGSSLLPSVAGNIGKTAGVAGSATGAVSGLTGAFSAWPVVLGVAGAALLGVGIYALDKHISKVEESRERVNKWGYDIGEQADKSMTKFDTFSSKAKASIDLFAQGATDDSKQIVQAFKGMGDEIISNTEKSLKDFTDSYDGYSAAVKNILKGSYEEEKKQAKERKKDVTAQQNDIKSIYENAAKNHRNLSSEESKMVSNIYKAMQEEQIESLDISNKKKKQMIKAMNGDVSGLNRQALQEQSTYFSEQLTDIQKKYDKQEKSLKKSYDKGQINKKTYNEALRQLDRERNDASFAAGKAWVETTRKLNDELGLSTKDSEKIIKAGLKELGLNYDDFTRNVQEKAGKVKDASKLISDGASDADIAWQHLVLDDKTGRVKTNLNDVIQDSSKSEKGWNNLKFIMKEAKLTSDAKEVIASALIENGRWDKMTFAEKELVVQYKDALYVENALRDAGVWNNLKMEQKQMIANAKTGIGLKTALIDMGVWDKVNPHVKQLLADNTDLINKINNGKSFIVEYNGKKVELKKLLSNNTDLLNKLKTGKSVIVNYNGEKIDLKYLFGNNLDLLNKFKSGKKTISDYNSNFNPLTKTLKLITDSLNGVTSRISEIDRTWSNFRPHGKTLTISKVMETPGLAPNAATGTNYHSGGPLLVNDAKGSKYEELVTTPNGQSFIPQGRNVLLDLPRGSSVLRGDKTAELMKNIPRFEKGTTNDLSIFNPTITPINTPFSKDISERKAIRRATGSTTEENMLGVLTAILNETKKLVKKPIAKVEKTDINNELGKAVGTEFYGGGITL
ncbi:phage tail tape measure protein [Listeria aquatica]|uniref:Phage tail tape measure protein n=1 Tax=Listeria aquatica TaxID=1494960 RepID=A0A841ZR03_9LIST|nr:phage tail tape measure protein [Listeria aquatica]